MDVKVLIVGYGRAGKRHGKMLDQLGIEWDRIDKDTPVENVPDDVYVSTSLEGIDIDRIAYRYDLAVVCTPPDDHLRHVKILLDAGVKRVLCEKPLCGLGQMEEARNLALKAGGRVSVAYNWRWHPQLRESGATVPRGFKWNVSSIQYRPDLPEWGLLLDHVAHSVDTLRFLSGLEDTVFLWEARNHKIVFEHPEGTFPEAERKWNHDVEDWEIRGHVMGVDFLITETVWLNENFPRRSTVSWPDGRKIMLDVSRKALDEMFLEMWWDVFGWVEGKTPPPIPMVDALKTQSVLEDAHDLWMRSWPEKRNPKKDIEAMHELCIKS